LGFDIPITVGDGSTKDLVIGVINGGNETALSVGKGLSVFVVFIVGVSIAGGVWFSPSVV